MRLGWGGMASSFVASFPGLPVFVLWFAFSIIHGSGRACIILNTNQRTKMGEAWEQG